jgi:hypothetical protein
MNRVKTRRHGPSRRLNFTLTFTDVELRAIRYWQSRHFSGSQARIAAVAHVLLLVALRNPALLRSQMNSIVRYCIAEGIEKNVPFLISLIGACPEYRRVRLPAILR